MGKTDLEVAGRFLAALRTAANTGKHEAVHPLLAPDVEWVTPKRTLRGIDEVKERWTWVSPPDHLDLEFEELDREDLGYGRIVSQVHEIYRMKESGEFAYERDRRIELTIRNGLISRYEMSIVG